MRYCTIAQKEICVAGYMLSRGCHRGFSHGQGLVTSPVKKLPKMGISFFGTPEKNISPKNIQPAIFKGINEAWGVGETSVGLVWAPGGWEISKGARGVQVLPCWTSVCLVGGCHKKNIPAPCWNPHCCHYSPEV